MFEEYIGLFLLGIATLLCPCCITLISLFLTYTVGVSNSIRRGLAVGCIFVAAMCLVFFFIGYAVTSLIPLSLVNYQLFFGISGVTFFLYGLSNSGLLDKVNLTPKSVSILIERVEALRLNALTRFSGYNYIIVSFLFGVTISLAVVPCSLSLALSAFLLTIITAPTPFHGGLLLLVFGLGHSLPVVFLSVSLAAARKVVSDKIVDRGKWLKKIIGFAFLVIGIIMIAYTLVGWIKF
jgi:cytochrome c biogenesis protein CcdA